MKKYITTIHLLCFFLSFISCRKQIQEPNKTENNQEYVYIEIDSEKYLVDDAKLNFNKNSIGKITDEYNIVADKVHYSNDFENTKLKNGQCSGAVDIAFGVTNGIQLPQYFRLTLKVDKDNQRPIDQIYATYDYNGLLNEFQDFKFNLINFDKDKKIVEYLFEGSALSIQDSLYHKLKIKSKTIFK